MMTKRRRIGCLLVAGSFVVLLCLLGLLFPALVKLYLNRTLIPRMIANPKIPLAAGEVSKLGYRRLSAGDFSIEPAPEVHIRVPEVSATYSPRSLLGRTVNTVNGSVVSEENPAFTADFSLRDIRLAPGKVDAAVSASVSKVRFKEWSAGPVQAAALLRGTNAAFRCDVPVQDGLLTASVSVAADWSTNPVWSCAAVLPLSGEEGAPSQLAALVPGIDDLQVAGNIHAELSGNQAGAEALIKVRMDSLELPKQSLRLQDLSTDCELHLSGVPRSASGQLLTLGSLSFGEIAVEQLRMQYQLEPDSVFYVEDLEFNLCKGRVSLSNVRIRPQMTDISVRLLCDRLSLEGVLTACGVDNFSGDGELNGRLPIRWRKSGLTVDRGFLFTTPGRGGSFAFGAAEVAASLLPPGSAESGQVGLVTAALAEFEYDWITMTLNTEGEELTISMEIAGRPVNVLPYEYDSKQGTYVKVALRSGRGTREPMRFTFNFSVPLNQLLWYASGINRQWKLFNKR